MILTDIYFINVRGLCQLPKADRVQAILNTLERSLHTGMRNRFLYDAVKLVQFDSWDAKNDVDDWSFEKVDALQLEERWRQEIGIDLFDKLQQQIKFAAVDTCRSFEQFQTRPATFATLTEFLEWYYANLPYATLNLAYDASWDSTVQQRIDWMLNKSPEILSEETREQLVAYAQRFIFDWHLPRYLKTSI